MGRPFTENRNPRKEVHILTELIQDMQVAAKKERERAKEIYGEINASDHESYAIMLEEAEEADTDRTAIINALNAFWACCRVDKENTLERAEQKKRCLETIEQHALMKAAESVQLAAMARKAIITINNRNDKEDDE